MLVLVENVAEIAKITNYRGWSLTSGEVCPEKTVPKVCAKIAVEIRSARMAWVSNPPQPPSVTAGTRFHSTDQQPLETKNFLRDQRKHTRNQHLRKSSRWIPT